MEPGDLPGNQQAPRAGHTQLAPTTILPRKQLHPIKLVLVLSILILLIVACSTLGYNAIFRPFQANLQGKVTSHTRTTTTGSINATITAQAQATSAELDQLQANYDQITALSPSLEDQLHHPDLNNWDTESGCAFSHGTYDASLTQKGYFVPCFAKNTHFDNFVYQVHMQIVKGDAGGIAFRANATNAQSYLFTIRQDSSYSIYYYPGDPKKITRKLTEGFSDLIITDPNQENVLAVIAKNHQLDFYINHTYLTSSTDTMLSSGQIGVFANEIKHDTEVHYSQIQVWKL